MLKLRYLVSRESPRESHYRGDLFIRDMSGDSFHTALAVPIWTCQTTVATSVSPTQRPQRPQPQPQRLTGPMARDLVYAPTQGLQILHESSLPPAGELRGVARTRTLPMTTPSSHETNIIEAIPTMSPLHREELDRAHDFCMATKWFLPASALSCKICGQTLDPDNVPPRSVFYAALLLEYPPVHTLKRLREPPFLNLPLVIGMPSLAPRELHCTLFMRLFTTVDGATRALANMTAYLNKMKKEGRKFEFTSSSSNSSIFMLDVGCSANQLCEQLRLIVLASISSIAQLEGGPQRSEEVWKDVQDTVLHCPKGNHISMW